MNLKRVVNIVRLFKKITFVCFFIFLSSATHSQNDSIQTSLNKDSLPPKNENDLLRVAKAYISKNENKKALSYLSKYYPDFSKNIYVNWLYAYTLSANNNNKKADRIFKKAISIDATEINLQLDYARFLYKIGKINKVESILKNVLDDTTTNLEFLMMLANIDFWKGDLKNARKKIKKIKTLYPKSSITKNLESEIASMTAGYLRTNFEYQTDSQPLEYIANHIVVGEYISRFLHPTIEISRYRFSPQEEDALIIRAKNQFYFHKLKLSANITGGIYVNHSDDADWIGGINFTKTLFKNASLQVGYAKNSLLGTIASTAINLTYQSGFAELDYSNKWFLLHGWYEQQFFTDQNEIQSMGSWILSQPLKIRNFSFQIGYSYNFTDSQDVLFFFDNQGVGIYDPYFTPVEQNMHSGIFVMNYQPTKKLSLEAKVNYGFIGTIRNPYPIQVTADSFEIGGFYDATFTPIELTGSINYDFSKNFTAKIAYIDQETFFYDRQNINLGLNFIF